MSGAFWRLAAMSLFAVMLSGCATEPTSLEESSGPRAPGAVVTPKAPIQCVPYARAHSGVGIFGDAYTWWDKATGKFARGTAPKQGAVMVLTGYAGPARAHLAVVREIVNGREIKVDHANWLDDGAIYLDDPVVDVSDANDWSAVRVWNIRAGAWGTRIYEVQGFIGPGTDAPQKPDEEPSSSGLISLLFPGLTKG